MFGFIPNFVALPQVKLHSILILREHYVVSPMLLSVVQMGKLRHRKGSSPAATQGCDVSPGGLSGVCCQPAAKHSKPCLASDHQGRGTLAHVGRPRQ